STPVEGWGYEMTDDAGGFLPEGKNSVTLEGLSPTMFPEGMHVFAITGQVEGDESGPAACYGCYDEDSIVKHTNTDDGDVTIMTVDIYLSSAVKRASLFVW